MLPKIQEKLSEKFQMLFVPKNGNRSFDADEPTFGMPLLLKVAFGIRPNGLACG